MITLERKYRKFFIEIIAYFLFIIFSNIKLYSNIDSLEKILFNSKNDSNKVNLLNDLSILYKDINADKGLKYGHDAFELATSLDYKKGMGYAYKNIGMNYWRIGTYDLALDKYFKALSTFEAISDTQGLAITNNYIGLIYFARSQYEKAINYLNKSISMNTIVKNNLEIARSRYNLGLVYTELKMYDLSLSYLHNSLNTCLHVNDSNLIASNYCFIGYNYILLEKYDSSYYYLKKSLKIFTDLNSLNNIAMVNNYISLYYNRIGNFNKSLFHSKTAYELGDQIGNKFMKMEALGLMTESYKGMKDYKNAFEVFSKNRDLLDSLRNEENVRSIARKETQYEYEKKINELEVKQKNELYQNQLLTIVLFIASLVVLAIAIIIYVFYKSTKKSNKILEEKNYEILKQKEELSVLNLKLIDSNNEKDKFFSIIANDLKIPFSNFLEQTKIMVEEIFELSMRQVQQFSKNMQITANELYKLLENLLEWSSIKRGIVQFNPEIILLADIVKNNLDFLKDIVLQKEIFIDNQVTDNLQVKADLQMLNNIIRNLLSNAIKYTHRSGKIEIGVEYNSNLTKEYEQFTIFYVKDNGIGMTSEILNNLFMIDKKNSRPGTEGELSSGLGLILCDEFVMKHNGKILIESQENEGSKFYVLLPKI